MPSDPQVFEQSLYLRLLNSPLYATYQDAFRSATGLPLRLVGADVESWCLDDQTTNRSPFCMKLNVCQSACNACVETNQRLMQEAAVNGPTTCHCFAGLAATAVPVEANGAVIGFLKTGQVFQQTPSEQNFNAVSRTLVRHGLKPSDVTSLREAYLQTQAVEPERYQSMVTLLATFAQQLGRHAESLAVIQSGSEPAAIAKAKKFIEASLEDPLPLSLVARQAGLSESHFCRVFKEVTGLTLTDYVNRQRIEWAKRELLKPDARISEIAFKVGYQSLSQFNRSFAKLTGRSPTRFRRDEMAALSA